MENEEMFGIAIQALNKLKDSKVESIEVEKSNYDDGTSRFTVDVIYPTKETSNLTLDSVE